MNLHGFRVSGGGKSTWVTQLKHLICLRCVESVRSLATLATNKTDTVERKLLYSVAKDDGLLLVTVKACHCSATS